MAPRPAMVDSRLGESLQLMNAALELLDEGEAPGEIGCHLSLAIARLTETLECPWPRVVRSERSRR